MISNPLRLFSWINSARNTEKISAEFTAGALALLENHDWPENVSELRDVMENAVLLADGPLITKDDIRFNISKKAIALESFLSREDFFTLEEIEHIYINTVLRRLKNNKSKTAKVLGVSRNTLQRRIGVLEEAARSQKTPQKRQSTAPVVNRSHPAPDMPINCHRYRIGIAIGFEKTLKPTTADHDLRQSGAVVCIFIRHV